MFPVTYNISTYLLNTSTVHLGSCMKLHCEMCNYTAEEYLQAWLKLEAL